MKRVSFNLRSRACFLFTLALATFGCSDPPVVTSSSAPSKSSAPAASASSVASASASASAAPPKVEVQENEFTESERSRDPFRSFANAFVQDTKAKVQSQREVILPQYALDELRLIGIVTRAEPAKAMLVDPTGKGYVIQRGQFVGRPDVVQAAGAAGTVYEINWRVDRIRPSDIVLIRADPANPDVPSATRVIALRPEDEPSPGSKTTK